MMGTTILYANWYEMEPETASAPSSGTRATSMQASETSGSIELSVPKPVSSITIQVTMPNV